jgi:hypothetical protein
MAFIATTGDNENVFGTSVADRARQSRCIGTTGDTDSLPGHASAARRAALKTRLPRRYRAQRQGGKTLFLAALQT